MDISGQVTKRGRPKGSKNKDARKAGKKGVNKSSYQLFSENIDLQLLQSLAICHRANPNTVS